MSAKPFLWSVQLSLQHLYVGVMTETGHLSKIDSDERETCFVVRTFYICPLPGLLVVLRFCRPTDQSLESWCGFSPDSPEQEDTNDRDEEDANDGK